VGTSAAEGNEDNQAGAHAPALTRARPALECGGVPPLLRKHSQIKIVVFPSHPITLTHETHEMTRKEEITELAFASEILVFFVCFVGK
jgi:hypothetical protein